MPTSKPQVKPSSRVFDHYTPAHSRRVRARRHGRPGAAEVPASAAGANGCALCCRAYSARTWRRCRSPRVTGLLGGLGPSRVSRDTQDVPGPGLDLHHEQHVHAPQQHGVDVQEVTGKDAGGLSGQGLPPDRPLPTRYPSPSSSPWMRRYTSVGSAAPVAPPARAPRPGPADVPARSGRSNSSRPCSDARLAGFPGSRSGAAAGARAAASPRRRSQHGQPSPASGARPDVAGPQLHAGGPRSPCPWRRHCAPAAPASRRPGP